MPPSRDERLPIDVLKRVMPKVDLVEEPHDPTLLETLTNKFYETENDGKS